MEKQKNAVGRRKEAVTRIFLSKGDGKITINGKEYKNYFPLVYLQNQVEAPFKAIEAADKFDIVVNATGGGVTADSGLSVPLVPPTVTPQPLAARNVIDSHATATRATSARDRAGQ